MSSGPSSIQRGFRQGRIGRTTIIGIAVVLAAVGGIAAWAVLAPRGAFEIVAIDGSSTVYPITAAWASDFNNPQRQVTVAISGTGGGFQKFCRGETDLNDASRPIKQSERDMCAAHVPPITNITEFRIGYDGLTIVLPKANDWVENLTVLQLCRIWTSNTSAGACGGAGPRVTQWSGLDASWPARAIRLYGPGTDSGTFDFFVEKIFAKNKAPILAANPQMSEDDNVLVQGVEGSPYAIGFFGYAYLKANQAKLRAVAVNGVEPSFDTAESGEYPMARPLFLYTTAKIMKEKPQVAAFVNYYLTTVNEEIEAVGYFPASAAELAKAKQTWLDATK